MERNTVMTSAARTVLATSAWDLDLSGHNHRHKCPVCDKIEWCEGTKAESLRNDLCEFCGEEGLLV